MTRRVLSTARDLALTPLAALLLWWVERAGKRGRRG